MGVRGKGTGGRSVGGDNPFPKQTELQGDAHIYSNKQETHIMRKLVDLGAW